MTTKGWSGSSGDWFGSQWVDFSNSMATSVPASGDMVFLDQAGTVTISAADAVAHGTINNLTVHFLYFGSGPTPVLDVTNASFGSGFAIDNFFTGSTGELIARGRVALAGTLSGDVSGGPAVTLDIEPAGGLEEFDNSGTIQSSNAGTLLVVGAAGAVLRDTGLVTATLGTLQIGTTLTVTGTGTLSASRSGTLLVTGAVSTAGSLLVGGANQVATAVFGGALQNSGTANVTIFGTLLTTAGVVNSGTFGNSGGLLQIGGGLVNDGTILASQGTTSISGAVSGTGTIVIGGTQEIEIAGSVAAGQTIAFTGGLGTLKLTDAAGFHGTINNFTGHTVIDLENVAATSAVTSNGTVTVFAGATELTSFLLAGGATLNTAWDGASGTVLTLEQAGTPAQVENAIINGGNGSALPNFVQTLGSDPTVSYWFDPASNWTTAEKQAFFSGLTLYHDVANINFIAAGSAATANIKFVRGLDGQAFEQTIGSHATISIDTRVGSWSDLSDLGTADTTGFGGYGFLTVLHEEGHALGLSHPGNYNETADITTQQSYYTDTHQYSVMSYFSATFSGANTKIGSTEIYDQSPMLYDIGALQTIYGANTATLSGNDVFGFNSTFGIASAHPLASYDFTRNTVPVVTLYDGGGNNTLDLSGFATASLVNLAPGAFSSVAGLSDNLDIYYTTHIDTVIGGAGDDAFVANADSDRIDGGGGTNTVLFAGVIAQYTLQRHLGTVTVSGFGATDTLTHIATLAFADQSIATASIACFAAGTRIATAQGDIPVEALRPGMRVLTALGGAAPLMWLGQRRIDCRHHPRPHDVWPVRVRAHAFGPGKPARDVLLSPDHAVYIASRKVLIPIRYLVNGASIAQEPADSVHYFHVELPTHQVILADGLPAESYLDTGNRSAFANGGAAVQLHPDFAARIWDERACYPLALRGPDVVAAKRQLLARATALGRGWTDDPDLVVLVDGARLYARIAGPVWRLALPAGARQMRLLSRAWVPAEREAASEDCRRLGVAIATLSLDGVAARLDDMRLHAGWQAPEPALRWTDGDGAITVSGHREVCFTLAACGRYWAGPDEIPSFGQRRSPRMAAR